MDVDSLYALDIETTGLSRFREEILCVGIHGKSFQKVFISLSDFWDWCDLNRDARFITHNGSFDFNFLKHDGIDLFDRWGGDTCALAGLMCPRPGSVSLEFLAEFYLGIPPYKIDRTKMKDYALKDVAEYCAKDCEVTFRLYLHLMESLSKDQKTMAFIESWLKPVLHLLAEMEFNGVFVDVEGIKQYQHELLSQKEELMKRLNDAAKDGLIAYHQLQVSELSKRYKEMYEIAKKTAKDPKACLNRYVKFEEAALSKLEPFNWASAQQVAWLLKEHFKLDLRDPLLQRDSTAEARLRALDHPVTEALCDFRENEKLLSSCIPALLENAEADGFIHPHYRISGTRSGRLSCANPNIQQIPKGPLRSYVKASRDARVFFIADFSQIEVRIIAEVAKEKVLLEAFHSSIDPYSLIAKSLLNLPADPKDIKKLHPKERNVSKTVGLSILYGTGATRLQEVLQKELGRKHSIRECQKFIQDYRDSLPAVKDFKVRLERRLVNGGIVHNLLGRPFSIPDNADLYMKSLNTLVQGSASDLVLRSALNIQARLREMEVDAQCRLLVHDEQVWELPQDEAELLAEKVLVPEMTERLQKSLNLSVPLKVEWTLSQQWEKPS